MTAYFVVFGMITLAAVVVTVLDGIAHRRNRRAHK